MNAIEYNDTTNTTTNIKNIKGEAFASLPRSSKKPFASKNRKIQNKSENSNPREHRHKQRKNQHSTSQTAKPQTWKIDMKADIDKVRAKHLD